MKYVAAYLTAIVLANLSSATFGRPASIPNAFFFIGLDITARDGLHEAWHHRHLWPKMAALIITGSLLSCFLNRDASQIATASLIAFAVAGLVDTLVYHALRRQPSSIKINTSNVCSSAADSLIFPTLAFAGLHWPTTIGQFVAKVAGGFLWSLFLTNDATSTD